MSSQSEVYRVLEQIRNGDPVASAQLLPLVYQELRELAAAKLRHERQGGDDQELRKRVEKLLEAHHQAASLFDADPADGEAVTMPPANRQSAPSVVGPYKLLQQIGEGGMGAVWMAQQEKPVRRRVALKLIRPDMGGVRNRHCCTSRSRSACAGTNGKESGRSPILAVAA